MKNINKKTDRKDNVLKWVLFGVFTLIVVTIIAATINKQKYDKAFNLFYTVCTRSAKNMNIYSFDCNCVARCTVERFKQFVSNPTIQYENDIDRIALKAMEGCYMPCYKK